MSEHDPADCCLCHRHAIGIGIGYTHQRDRDPKWICHECALIIEDVRRVKNFDAYELKALDGSVDAVGDYIESLGGKTELADYDELEQRMLCKAAVTGFGNRLRELVRTRAPF